MILTFLLLLYLQTNHGDIEFGFFPRIAPKTVEHIFKLVRLGCYNTNHFFRVFISLYGFFFTCWSTQTFPFLESTIAVNNTLYSCHFQVDKGFVAQVADVVGGRTAPMNEEQKKEAEKTVVGEFSSVKHVRGILSMGRCFLYQILFDTCFLIYHTFLCLLVLF
jgi:hypothetical protein